MKNVIAIVWDFDKTLISGYMQDPIFKKYGVDAHEFWTRINGLSEKYKREQNVLVNKDTIYLNEFIRESKAGGKFEGLCNEDLLAFGKELSFYDGAVEIFDKTTHLLTDELCKEYNITVEHYIVSTGFAQVIRGSVIMGYVRDIWGCELIQREEPALNNKMVLGEIGYTIDNTTKTRALFEISKGVVHDTITHAEAKSEIDVNSKMTDDQRRVDFKNMIYIADGPSDVPAFSVVKGRGGSTFAVYPKCKQENIQKKDAEYEKSKKSFQQIETLRMEGRVDMYAEADYREGTTANMWICNKINELANRIKKNEANKRNGIESGTPMHLI